MRIKDVIAYLDDLIPPSMQESYDNSGFQIGNKEEELSGVLVSLDCTEEIVEEARRKGCNLIVAHHPVIFKGIRKLTGSSYVERTVMACLREGIALYTIHTNLDNFQHGVNAEIGRRIGLKNLRILEPKKGVLHKLIVFVPASHHEMLNNALFKAGAGRIGNYEECHFSSEGTGTFKPVGDADPYSGKLNELSRENEIRVEYLVSSHVLGKVLSAMRETHPYEEIAHDVILLANENQTEGSGMIGELDQPMDELELLNHVKNAFGCGVIRHTRLLGRKVSKVAFCGGSGSFLLKRAIASQADVFITGDFKYHEFFDAEDRIVIADIGHYESEQFTSNLLVDILKKKITTFAVHLTEINTNPINYL